MEKAPKEELLIKRSMRSVLLLSAIYAIVSNIYLYTAYYNNVIIKWSYPICTILVIAFAFPIVKWFRNRHWYFPALIVLFWIPFGVLLGYLLSKILPNSTDNYDFGLLLVYFFILNVSVMFLAVALGMLINACWMLWAKFRSRSK